ncbi:MAG: hypothetical protein PHC29_06225 [Candidatus Omnitrophica bacterium]|nr:hypothetical protein [Candidatus Omnitrophota bacterium]
MGRLLKSIFLIFFLLFFCSISVFAAEEITITTYYPSPYGSYNQLQASTLGVGDNNGNGVLDSRDVPNPTTNPGEVWIRGRVGIGGSSTFIDIFKDPKLTLWANNGVDGGGDLIFKDNGNDAGDIVWINSSNTQLGRIWTNTGGLSELYFSSGDITADLTIKANGDVGIGTTDPNSKFQVVGNYLQIPTMASFPPASDCNEDSEVGRMVVSGYPSEGFLWVCLHGSDNIIRWVKENHTY